MSSGEEQDNIRDVRGFTGLALMVSDVEDTILWAARVTQRAKERSSAERDARAVSASDATQPSPPPKFYQDPALPPRSRGLVKPLVGVCAIALLGWLFSDMSGRSPAPVSHGQRRPIDSEAVQQLPTAERDAPPSSDASGAASASSAPAPRQPEEAPPLGSENVLFAAQLRYCVAERIRLEAAHVVVNTRMAEDVDRFNAMVVDFNGRCGQYRYRDGALEAARREVERYRAEIQQEGRARFSHQ